MIEHLNSFSARVGGFEQKFSKNSNARGLPGGMLKLQFDWYTVVRKQKIALPPKHFHALA